MCRTPCKFVLRHSNAAGLLDKGNALLAVRQPGILTQVQGADFLL